MTSPAAEVPSASSEWTGASEVDLDTHVRNCWRAQAVSSFVMPWERKLEPIWEAAAKRPRLQIKGAQMPPVPIEAQAAPGPPKPNITPALDCFVEAGLKPLKASAVLYKDKLAYERKAACKKWVAIIAVCPNVWQIVQYGFGSQHLRFAQGGIVDHVRDALAGKATSTLHARAGPMLRYIQFCHREGLRPFPVVEPGIYNFVKGMVSSAPTFPRSFLIALSFSHHVLGLQGVVAILDSGRIRGATASHFTNRAQVRQRPALTVAQVVFLEGVVMDESRTPADRVAAGFFLVLVYGRLRFSDAQSIASMDLDEIASAGDCRGFLECTAHRTKTSITLQRKIRALPVVIPLLGLTEKPWIPAWLEIRRQQGLFSQGQVAPSSAFLLPSPAHGGGWTGHPLGVSSAAQWLRNLLKSTDTQGSVPLGTHSCKATLLSWMSKRGLPHGPRRLLGYHISRKDDSLIIYSRDALASPLRLLCTMLHEVRDQTFQPDVTRSGMLSSPVPPSDLPREVPEHPEAIHSESSEDSADEEDGDATDEECAVNAVAGAWGPELAADCEGQFARHKMSRCLHRVLDESGAKLKCGRNISSNMEILDDRPAFMYPICTTCFGNCDRS